MKNYRDTIITQYRGKPIIEALLADWNDDLSPEVNFILFFSKLWKLDTATGYGLDVWGRIVGVSRNLKNSAPFDYFGFDEAVGCTPFGEGVPTVGDGHFYTGAVSPDDPLTLTDAVFRQLILLKAAANLSNGSAYVLNATLAAIFGARAACYAQDLGGMKYLLFFKFFSPTDHLTPADYTLLAQTGVFPRPAGVSVEIMETH